MTYDKLLDVFSSWGLKLPTEHYWDFKQYCQNMLKRNRMMVVVNDGQVLAVLFFFITNDYNRIYRKGEFEYPMDNPYGFQVYVDKMLCKNWNYTIRKIVQQRIEESFPHVKEAVYHRAPNDRCVKIYRRRQLCTK